MDNIETKVCYSSDPGFLLPSVASIASLRSWESGKHVKICYLGVGYSVEQKNLAREMLSEHGVEIEFVENGALQQFSNERFNKTHVPVASLSRFLLCEAFGASEAQLLYIDGDTFFAADPGELLSYLVPVGKLAAVEDQSSMYAKEVGRHGNAVRAYFDGIGVDASNGYFNAGIFKTSFDTWAEVSHEALEFLRRKLEVCLYHDQSAMNAVCSHRRVTLSPIWNYQSAFLPWNHGQIKRPIVCHFVGGGKPWLGDVPKWKFIAKEYNALFPASPNAELFPIRKWSADEQRRVHSDAKFAAMRQNLLLRPRLVNRRKRFAGWLQASEI